MKSLINIIPFVLLLTISPTLFGQDHTIGNDLGESPIQTQMRGKNIISCTHYDSIKFNGYTIGQINTLNGDFTQFFGTPDSLINHEGIGKSSYYGENSIGYNSEGYTSGITILDSVWPIKIMYKEIRVGDSFSELKQKFGNDLKIIFNPAISSRYVVSFNCDGNEYDGLLIYFNPVTHNVEEIKYFVNT